MPGYGFSLTVMANSESINGNTDMTDNEITHETLKTTTLLKPLAPFAPLHPTLSPHPLANLKHQHHHHHWLLHFIMKLQ